MGHLAEGQPSWVLQPLLDAGLGTEQVSGLLFRLAFDAVIAEGPAPGDPADLVADQPAAVRAAWSETIGRMVVLDLLASG